ncbi:hypothetical protein cgR_2744 [Corynebacterium glutamicum R]|uniref:Uncharacterized protein n=1 Tax=Corynebacterium glutamicum (strain R) TaxID=340322 RepID=A0AB72VEI0_CORGB|nr:hypothetical protein cgR_2744 [Corynebacterium glutamicum R]
MDPARHSGWGSLGFTIFLGGGLGNGESAPRQDGDGAWQASKGTNLLILTTGSGFSAVCGGFLQLAGGLMQKSVPFEGLATGLRWILDQQADRNHRSPNRHKFYPL